MTLTIMNWLGLGFLVLTMIVGGTIKSSTARKVKRLHGMKGLVKKKEKKTEGNILVRFGD